MYVKICGRYRCDLLTVVTVLGLISPSIFGIDLSNPEVKTAQAEFSSMEGYLNYAENNNRELKAAYYKWKEKNESIKIANSLPDPKVRYGHFLRDIETRTGPQQHRIGISQTLPWFGKRRTQKEQAIEIANAEYQEYEAKKLNLRRDVKVVYYELHYLREAIEITQSNMTLLKKLEGVTQSRVKTGGDLSTLIKLQTEIAKLDDQLESLKRLRQPLQSQLNNLLNLPIQTDHPWPQENYGPSVMQIETKILEGFEILPPKLSAMKHRIESSERLIERRKKDFYPDISIGIDYIETGESVIPNTADNGRDPIIASVSFSLPIWRGKHIANLNSAKHQRNHDFYLFEQNKNRLLSNIQISLNKFEEADRRVHLYHDSLIPLAESAFDISQESYKNNNSTFIELIDVQRSLLEFQLIYQESLKNRLQHAAHLEALVGNEVVKVSIKTEKENR